MNMQYSNFIQNPSVTSISSPASFSFTSTTILAPQRYIDSKNIDIASIKGRFAWEKIPDSDIYIPVIFRGETKYFCLKILRKVLRELPEDIFHQWSQYQYRKPIELNHITSHELKLLNRINVHHARWSYTRQGFTLTDEIIRVSDFLAYYQYLRQVFKSGTFNASSSSTTTTITTANHNVLRPNLNQAQKTTPSSSVINNTPRTLVQNAQTSTTKKTTNARRTYAPPQTVLTNQPRNVTVTSIQPVQPSQASSSSTTTTTARPRSMNPVRTTNHVSSVIPQPSRVSSTNTYRPEPVATTAITNVPEVNNVDCKPTVLPEDVKCQINHSIQTPPTQSSNLQTSELRRETSATRIGQLLRPATTTQIMQSQPIDDFSNIPVLSLSSLSSTPSLPSNTTSTTTNNETDRRGSNTLPSVTTNKSSSSVRCGWIQINKLYTPYVSVMNANHHQYRIPVSLLTYYDLLKIPSVDTMNFQDSNESSKIFEQTTATQTEIDLINEQCRKHNLRPFLSDTKLVTLETFYQYCTPSIIFVKELPSNEPKAAICKEWPSIVQMNGGICRLRNMTNPQEQTVPFIGNKLLKNFILSSSISNTALIKPTDGEIEFLQLILFYSNLSINLRNAQLIDIELVKKEYNVDLILLFNDKFALNVLNYQEKGNRPNTSQSSLLPQATSASNNTIAESTPPPSPPSPPSKSTDQPTNTTTIPTTTSLESENTIRSLTTTETKCQLPLTNAPASNRYQKTIEFHGHRLTAFVCSGIGSNVQRECISVRSLCNILAPDYSNIEKLEMKMLRLLRSKNVNRFRPQNQQSLGFTRLIDVRDAEANWTFLEQEIRLAISKQAETSSISTENSKCSDPDNLINIIEPVKEVSVEKNKTDKRPLDEPLEQEDVPVLERLKKRVRLDDTQSNQTVMRLSEPSTTTDTNNEIQTSTKPKSKKSSTKTKRPQDRSNRQAVASWVKKYAIEDCCIRLDSCQLEINLD